MKNTDWWSICLDGRNIKGKGPVEFLQTSFKLACVEQRSPKIGEYFLSLNPNQGWIKAKTDSLKKDLFVIPSDSMPCPNCQANKPWAMIEKRGMFKTGKWSCFECERPEPEWIYADKIDTNPCPNCQNAVKNKVNWHGNRVCTICGRPEPEWTYAQEPDWAGIGSGIM